MNGVDTKRNRSFPIARSSTFFIPFLDEIRFSSLAQTKTMFLSILTDHRIEVIVARWKDSVRSLVQVQQTTIHRGCSPTENGEQGFPQFHISRTKTFHSFPFLSLRNENPLSPFPFHLNENRRRIWKEHFKWQRNS